MACQKPQIKMTRVQEGNMLESMKVVSGQTVVVVMEGMCLRHERHTKITFLTVGSHAMTWPVAFWSVGIINKDSHPTMDLSHNHAS